MLDIKQLIEGAIAGAGIFASGVLVGKNNPKVTDKLESIASDVKTIINTGVGAVKGALQK